eukprot:2154431-Pyramimonas_sp.AAC.1
MGVRRCGASWREALVDGLAKGAPMLREWANGPGSGDPELTKPGGLARDRAADPVELLEKCRA